VVIHSETSLLQPSPPRSTMSLLGGKRLRTNICVLLLEVTSCSLLMGCGDAAPTAQPGVAPGTEDVPAQAQVLRQAASPAAAASPAPKAQAMVQRLFAEVKRLNAGCVAAGGGVSGSPDCDVAQTREDDLEGLGYCIDYPNGETLIRCPAPSGADDGA
jgi:hypothetical protein